VPSRRRNDVEKPSPPAWYKPSKVSSEDLAEQCRSPAPRRKLKGQPRRCHPAKPSRDVTFCRPPTHQPTSPNPQSPNVGRAPARDLKKAEARVPAWGERSKDGTLNRVGVAPAGVTAVRPQASMAFAGGPPTTRPNARSHPTLPTPQAETRGEMNLAGEAQDPAPSPRPNQRATDAPATTTVAKERRPPPPPAGPKGLVEQRQHLAPHLPPAIPGSSRCDAPEPLARAQPQTPTGPLLSTCQRHTPPLRSQILRSLSTHGCRPVHSSSLGREGRGGKEESATPQRLHEPQTVVVADANPTCLQRHASMSPRPLPPGCRRGPGQPYRAGEGTSSLTCRRHLLESRQEPDGRDQTKAKSPRHHLPWGRADIRRRPPVTTRWAGVEGGRRLGFWPPRVAPVGGDRAKRKSLVHLYVHIITNICIYIKYTSILIYKYVK
jgi:hypothetical protein